MSSYKSNCLFYVLGKMLKDRRERGHMGYLLMRGSYLAQEFGITNPWHPAKFVPHFLHRDIDHVVTQFAPTKRQRERDFKHGIWYVLLSSWLTLWWHEGEIVGDDIPGQGRPIPNN